MSTPRQKRSKFVPIPLLCFIVYSVATADPSQVTLIRTPNGGIQPQAAMDRQGALHLIYYKGDARNGDIFYVSQQLDQKEFSKPIQVNTRPGSAIAAGTIRGAQMALGRNGRVHVAWNGPAPERGSYMEAPMLYARLYDTRTAFEAERDVITFARGLDGRRLRGGGRSRKRPGLLARAQAGQHQRRSRTRGVRGALNG